MTSDEEKAFEDALDGSDWQVPPPPSRAVIQAMRATIASLVATMRVRAQTHCGRWAYCSKCASMNEAAEAAKAKWLRDVERPCCNETVPAVYPTATKQPDDTEQGDS